jgi:hypothetical protein
MRLLAYFFVENFQGPNPRIPEGKGIILPVSSLPAFGLLLPQNDLSLHSLFNLVFFVFLFVEFPSVKELCTCGDFLLAQNEKACKVLTWNR